MGGVSSSNPFEEADRMENQNSKEPKVFGMKRDLLMAGAAIFAPTITILIVVVALFGVVNANISRLNDVVTELVAQNAAQDTAIEALHSDLRDLNEDVDALSADVLELKLESLRTNNRLDSIETRLDGVDTRLVSLERGQTDLKDRIVNLERGQTELKDHVDALRPVQPASQ